MKIRKQPKNVILPYLYLMRLDRPIGILLLLWPTLIALWLTANGFPDPRVASIFILGVVVMRSAGCVINDITDRKFDGHVQRTKLRPLVTGDVSVRNAFILFISLIALACLLLLQLSRYTISLACIAAGLTILYPFAKRFTNYPQFILGLAFSWSIPMVYAQVADKLYIETWLVFCSTIAWVIAYDTQYALADKIDDLKVGIKSTAISFGNADRFIICILQIASLTGFAALGWFRHFSILYYACLLAALSLVFYQQNLIKNRTPEQSLQAFKNNNYFGGLIFFGLLLSRSAWPLIR